MKKIIIGVLVALLLISTTGGFIYFYLQNKKQIEMNAQLAQQNAQVQAQIEQIGALTEVYQVAAPKKSGYEIKEEDLIKVSVPVSSVQSNIINDVTQFKGKYYKININPGTNLTTDLLMESNTDIMRYKRDINLNYLPVGTKVNDYIDIRVLFPTGEEFMVIPHKQIKGIVNKTISVEMSEEELQVWNAAMLDYAIAQRYGMVLYVTKYLEPGRDTDALPFYPVQHEAESLVMYNTNITDYTRCVNSNMRNHIDHIIGMLKLNSNSTVANDTQAFFGTEASTIASAYDLEISKENEKKESESEVSLDKKEDEAQGIGESVGDAVGDAVDDIKDSTSKIEENAKDGGIE